MEVYEIGYDEADKWDNFINSMEYGHSLQLYCWGDVKKVQGWECFRLALKEGEQYIGVCSILSRTVPILKKSIMYVPFGPIINDDNEEIIKFFMQKIIEFCKKKKFLVLKVHPNKKYDYLKKIGSISSDSIFYKHTFVIDLKKDEEEIFSGLHKKLRNEIRKAEKLGTNIVEDYTKEGITEFYRMYNDTYNKSKRKPLPISVFKSVYENYIKKNRGALLFAEANGKRISGSIILKNKNSHLYMWGASIDNKEYDMYEGQKYLLWKSMIEAKKDGALLFDLGGVTIGAPTGTKKYGIYLFKKKFGGDLIELPGTYEIVYNRALWSITNFLLKIYFKFR